MPELMAPSELRRAGGVSIHLKPGRVPKLDGKPADLTDAEISKLRARGIHPTPQPEPETFAPKTIEDGLEFVEVAPDETSPKPKALARITPVKIPIEQAIK
jgi:hypothetical protein